PPRNMPAGKAVATAPVKKAASSKPAAAKAPQKKGAPAPKPAVKNTAAKAPAKQPKKDSTSKKEVAKALPPKRPTSSVQPASASAGKAVKSSVQVPPKVKRELNDMPPPKPGTTLHGFAPYMPAKGEEYMNETQREHFRKIMLAWRQELM